MSEASQDPRVTEAGYLGITEMTDDVIDVDDLYEALLNPHDGAGQGKGGTPPGGGMMMPPMGMMGGGAGGGGGGGAAAAGLPGGAAMAAAGGVARGGGITGAGGGGLGAEPVPPGTAAAGGGELPDIGGGGGGIGGLGDLGGMPDGGGGGGGMPDLGGGPGGPGGAGKGLGDDPAGKAVAHSGDTMATEAKTWEMLAQAWPKIRADLEQVTGRDGADPFGLVHEMEHGFNEAHGWLVERAREASEESTDMIDALVEARKKWEQTEQENVATVSQLKVEEHR